MDKTRILPGELLVSKGALKINSSLPEVGLKDVTSNGSWLEQKQIQSALEARKQLIEVERIEKSGVLSHAEWREELMLAEVTQKVGGYWQYLGHNVGKKLFLKPEEALFLMEVNCLLLKYNEVKVSLQQAYALLLRSKISLMQYKVYASLSRLGYRVFRHKIQSDSESTELEKKNKPVCSPNEVKNMDGNNSNSDSIANENKVEENDLSKNNVSKTDNDEPISNDNDCAADSESIELEKKNKPVCSPNEVKNMDGKNSNSDSIANENKVEENDLSKNNVSKTNKDEPISNDNDCAPDTESTELEKKNKPVCSPNEVKNMDGKNSNSDSIANENKVEENDLSKNNVSKTDKDELISNDNDFAPDVSSNGGVDIPSQERSENLNPSTSLTEIYHSVISEQPSTSGCSKKADMKQNKLKSSKYIQYKINKLKCRKIKTKQCDISNDYFEHIPEFTKNPTVEITAPDRRYLPGKIYLKNNSYCLNVEKIQTKSTSPEETMETSSSPNDTMTTLYQNNENHLRHPPPQNHHSYRGSNWTEYVNFRFASQPNPFRQFNFWRQQTSLNYFHFNMTFQRPLLYPQFSPRFMVNPFLPPFMMPNFNQNMNFISNNFNTNRKKRNKENLKQEHYASIQRLATFIKNSILQLRLSDHNVTKLNHLIQTYNTRYKTRLRLSNDFTVITDENIIDTIEVDDDEPIAKKAKKDENPEDAFNDRLHKLNQLAFKLKNMEMKNEATSRQRRMFSNMIRAFNTCYKVDYYVNDNYDIVNRNDLTVLDSSDSDSVAETSCAPPSGKKLKNPFSILKQLSEKQLKEENHTCTADSSNESPFRYSELTIKTFKKEWLPDKSDFGRAEVVSKDFASEVIDMRREEFLFDFLKIQPDKFKNWLDIKISFLQCLQETCELFHYDIRQKDNGLQSLVKHEEFNDASLVLKKLGIFKNIETTNVDTNLAIDFDVYNRNVQHFKKSDRPLPHFRVICIRESSIMPSGADVASLHSKYKDNVTIIFAVVGSGSISYLQVNPIDLPVYISSNNTVS